MTSTREFIAIVQAEIESIKNKITDLESQKAKIDTEISKARTDLQRRSDLLLVWEGKVDVHPRNKSVRRRPRTGGMKVILEILESSGRPLTAREILEGLIIRKAAGRAKKPISTVHHALMIFQKRGQVVSPRPDLFCLPGKESGTGPDK